MNHLTGSYFQHQICSFLQFRHNLLHVRTCLGICHIYLYLPLMLASLAYIVWNVSPEIFSIGSWPVRWYGLFFALAFLVGQYVLIKIYKGEGRSEKDVEILTIYMVIAVIIGARLGHVLFYQPMDYLNNPLDILKIWEGGLASHGAAAGILIAIYMYSRKHKQSYLYVLDRMVIVVALAGFFIRMGNLMNSEIIGEPTTFAGAFVFVEDVERSIEHQYSQTVQAVDIVKNEQDTTVGDLKLEGVDMKIDLRHGADARSTVADVIFLVNRSETLSDLVQVPYQPQVETKESSLIIKAFGVPRHPAQLYEALSSLLIFFLLYYLYSKKKGSMPEGRLFAYFMIILFSFRFFYEFLKEPQVGWEEGMVLNMGQILSIPLVIIGLFILMRTYRKKNEVV